MKYTLLKIVQSYLTRTDGFYVDSVFDTDESQQVAEIAEDVFYDLYSKYRDTQFSMKLRTLDAVSDTSRPNYLRLPDEIKHISESKIYYDTRDLSNSELQNYKLLEYMTPHEFLELMQKRIQSSDTNYQMVQDFNRTRFPVKTDKHPEYYTSFDGTYVVFDSFNQDDDSSLQESKSRIYSSEHPVWLYQDDYLIDLPEHLHPLFRDLVLVECYEALRQESAPASVARRANAGLLKLQQDNNRIGSSGRKPVNYARRVSNGSILRHNAER